MLPKPEQTEEDKLKPDNWRHITLTNAIYKILLELYREGFKMFINEKRMKTKAVEADKQKGFLWWIQCYYDQIDKVQLLLPYANIYINPFI
jgi:hypothetical protein